MLIVKDQDSLRELLREWEAPEPSAALDTRVRAAYREKRRRGSWWSWRVSIPVPVLAAALLMIAAGWWIERRATPPVRSTAPAGYITRLDAAGFQPLPDGEIRIIRSGDRKQ
jgi:hypothetical protein